MITDDRELIDSFEEVVNYIDSNINNIKDVNAVYYTEKLFLDREDWFVIEINKEPTAIFHSDPVFDNRIRIRDFLYCYFLLHEEYVTSGIEEVYRGSDIGPSMSMRVRIKRKCGTQS